MWGEMKTYLEMDEVQRLEEAATCLRDKVLIRLMGRLGCRVSEALGVAVEDIDFDQGVVVIEHLKVRLDLACPECGARLGKTHSFCPRCGTRVQQPVTQERDHRHRRVLPLDPDTLSLLREYVDRGGPVSSNGRHPLFGVARNTAWHIVQDCARRAGLGPLVNPETGRKRGVSPHRLRDAFATHAVRQDDSGDALRLLQEMLGHRSFNTTARYRKVAGQELRSWYQKLWGNENG